MVEEGFKEHKPETLARSRLVGGLVSLLMILECKISSSSSGLQRDDVSLRRGCERRFAAANFSSQEDGGENRLQVRRVSQQPPGAPDDPVLGSAPAAGGATAPKGGFD